MWKTSLKNRLKEIARTKSSPDSIATGFAVGTFIGILPTPGLSVLLGIIILFLFPKISKYALFIALAIWNPIVMGPFYYLSYQAGSMIIGASESMVLHTELMRPAQKYMVVYLTGNVAIALAASAISFFLVRHFTTRYQQRKAREQLEHLPSKE